MTTLVLENPSIEKLEDGRNKIVDSFGKLIKIKALYGDRFEIEPMDGNYMNIHQEYWGKKNDNTGNFLVTPGHEGYILYPFSKAMMAEKDGKLAWNMDDEFICIIPEGFRKTMKSGKYILDTRENAIPALADYAKNLDTGDIYNAQEMGGSGDIEYRFISDLITLYDQVIGFFDEVDHISGMEEILPLCVKRIGYLKQE